jgi:BirA family biotin operon repressor/biotin-[acetyl-CoA-carboxylase] ligase
MSSKILKFFEIDSTNLECKRIIDSKSVLNSLQNNIIVTAQVQTQGRGRLDRNWVSLQGNMMFSIIIPKAWVKNFNTLPVCVCLAIFREISPNIDVKFKWPNDLLIIENGVPKKFCGVLIENYAEFCIIGIGVNVVGSPPVNTLFPATHLQKYGIQISSEEKINASLLEILNENQVEVLKKWQEMNYFQGKNVKINGIEGIFEGVDENFSVILRNNAKETRIITFGDVS